MCTDSCTALVHNGECIEDHSIVFFMEQRWKNNEWASNSLVSNLEHLAVHYIEYKLVHSVVNESTR